MSLIIIIIIACTLVISSQLITSSGINICPTGHVIVGSELCYRDTVIAISVDSRLSKVSSNDTTRELLLDSNLGPVLFQKIQAISKVILDNGEDLADTVDGNKTHVYQVIKLFTIQIIETSDNENASLVLDDLSSIVKSNPRGPEGAAIVELAHQLSLGNQERVYLELSNTSPPPEQAVDRLVLRSIDLVTDMLGSWVIVDEIGKYIKTGNSERTNIAFGVSNENGLPQLYSPQRLVAQLILTMGYQPNNNTNPVFHPPLYILEGIRNEVKVRPSGELANSISGLVEMQRDGKVDEVNQIIEDVAEYLAASSGNRHYSYDLEEIVDIITDSISGGPSQIPAPEPGPGTDEPDPDEQCFFDPSLPHCASVDGECPDNFFTNEDEQCVPEGECSEGYHSVEDDESGACYPDESSCPENMILNLESQECQDKENFCEQSPESIKCEIDDGVHEGDAAAAVPGTAAARAACEASNQTWVEGKCQTDRDTIPPEG